MSDSHFIIIAVILLASTLVAIFSQPKLGTIIAITACTLISITPRTETGEVRYIGTNTKWPHSESGYGIVRSLNDQNLPFTFGNHHAKILVIATNYSASIDQEEIVILEPNAKLTTSIGIIRASTIPLGTVNEIIDARNINLNGKELGPTTTIGRTIVIATGSPSRQSLLKLIKK